jgi:hypothetical protein
MSKFTFVISIPDLRNGSLVNIQQAAPKAAMSVLYHWPAITGLPHDKAVEGVEFSIRASYAQFVHTLGNAATPALLEQHRKKAIVLGAIRAGAAAAFKLSAQDMTISECTAAGMTYSAVNNRVVESAGGGTATARWAAAQSMQTVTTEEEAVIATCVYMGMAVPALQGVSLVSTGHHYIPPTYNLFKGIKRQSLGSASQATKTWIEGMGEDFDDMAFHKACHPISPTLKRSLSKSKDLAARLKASGHGSAAIRLPAVPSEASGGKAAVALAASASSTVEMTGEKLDYSQGVALLLSLESAAEGPAEATACDAVVAWVSSNASKLAFCAGIVQQVHESTGTGRNTLLAAYSVKRLMADHAAEVSRGIQFARAVSARQRESMERGEFTGLNFVLP